MRFPQQGLGPTPTRQLCRVAAVLCLLLPAGCSCWRPSEVFPLPTEAPDCGLRQRITDVPPGPQPPAADAVIKPGGDKPPAANKVVFTLADAIAYALEHNPRLPAARAAIERSIGQEISAFAPFLPHVDVLNRYVETSPNLGPGAPGLVGAVEGGLADERHRFGQVELQVQWTLFDFGRRCGRYGQALSRERIAELQFARAKQTVVYDTAVAYVQVLLTAALRVVRDEAIRSAEATLKDSRARRAGGVADRDDVLRAEVLLSETRESLVLARQAEDDALARLNYALGRPAGCPLQVVDLKAEPSFDLSLAKALEVAADLRPEIGAARAAIATAQYGEQAARAEFWPRIYLLASAGYVEGQNVLTGFQDGFGLHLNQPLFAGGQRIGDLRSAEADIQSAVANAKTMLDGIGLEVCLSHRAVLAARERIDLSRTAIEQATENLRLVRVKYRNGNATPTDIVDAETALTRARQRNAAALYDYLSALARLEYALGSPPGNCLPAATNPLEGPAVP